MCYEVTINKAPHNNKTIKIYKDSVTILVGKNRSGKTRALESIKPQLPESVFLRKEFEDIRGIQSFNMDTALNNQRNENAPRLVSSIVASNPDLFKIYSIYFKILFNVDLKAEANIFKTEDFTIDNEADGFKSLFNLLYFLISKHKVLLFDEPERFLHPSLVSFFISSLSRIAKNYNKTFIIATHSSNMIRFDLENLYIYLLKINPNIIIDIRDKLDNLTVQSYKTTKQKDTFNDWFYYHSDLLFSSEVLLVEGFSDQIVLDALRQKFSYELLLKDIAIKHVASSYGESGGISKLYKIQSFLKQLFTTYCLSDYDILKKNEINKWYKKKPNDCKEKIINECAKKGLLILKRGEIEDYYFKDRLYNYCKPKSNFKKNKILAAYEQAKIINNEGFDAVKSQYEDIYEIFKSISIKNLEIYITLKDLAKNYFIDKYINKLPSEHLNHRDEGDKVIIDFKFIPSEEISFNKEDLKNWINSSEKLFED